MKPSIILTLLFTSAVFLSACNSGGSSAQYLKAGTYTATMSNYSGTGRLPQTCDASGITPISPVTITTSGVECAGGECSPTPINLNNNPCFSAVSTEDGGDITYSNCAVSASNVFTTITKLTYMENGQTVGTCSFTYTLTPQ